MPRYLKINNCMVQIFHFIAYSLDTLSILEIPV